MESAHGGGGDLLRLSRADGGAPPRADEKGLVAGGLTLDHPVARMVR